MQKSLSPAKIKLARTISFEEEILRFVKNASGGELRQAVRFSEMGGQSPMAGLSISVADADAAKRLINQVQPSLLARGYRAFWSKRRQPSGLAAGDEVVILKTLDELEIVKVRSTNGYNYNVFTQDIIDRIKVWKTLCHLTVVGAATDSVAITFQTIPEHLCEFAAEACVFCPDVVSQCFELSQEKKRKLLAASRKLCPEIPEFVHQRRLDRFAKLIAASENSQGMREFIDSKEVREEVESGVRLLAHEIKERKYLFLWWD